MPAVDSKKVMRKRSSSRLARGWKGSGRRADERSKRSVQQWFPRLKDRVDRKMRKNLLDKYDYHMAKYKEGHFVHERFYEFFYGKQSNKRLNVFLICEKGRAAASPTASPLSRPP